MKRFIQLLLFTYAPLAEANYVEQANSNINRSECGCK